MSRNLTLPLALFVSACNVQQMPANNQDSISVANADTVTAVIANNAAPAPIAATPGGGPSKPNTSPPGTEQAVSDVDKQPAAAVAVLQAYCDAIAHKNYRVAYEKWGDDGQRSGRSFDQFVAAYKKYDAFDCSFSGPLDAEGAAGSIYLTVPTVITGTLAKGGGFTLRGPITMRRVNDVDGSTAAQRRWHIESTGLTPRR